MVKMHRVQVDARGLECPKPVIFTKKAVDENRSGIITSIVDNEIAKENILKFAKSQNMEAHVTEQKGVWYIDLYQKNTEQGLEMMPERHPDFWDMVILIGSNYFGHGERELGEILMKGYFYTLTETAPYPKALLFVNSGICLTLDDSPVLEHIRKLESEGVQVLSCGTCLDYYKVKDRLAVGGVTNMYTIVEMTNGAKNTIRI